MKPILAVFLLLSWAASLHAQVNSLAFDPKCYQPVVGTPGVIDTIYGSENLQGLGGGLFNVGPKWGESFGRILTTGILGNVSNYTSLKTGPDFNLQKLMIEKKMNLGYRQVRPIFGHFRSPKYRDLLIFDGAGTPNIFWADDSGNYDNSRTTTLIYRKRGDSNFGSSYGGGLGPYIAHLSSDSVDDIVFGCYSSWYNNSRPDSAFIVYFKGGGALYNRGSKAFSDSALYSYNLQKGGVHVKFGDWRGTGRADCIATDGFSNLLYYTNDRPFSLQRFAAALEFDTLFARWQNPKTAVGLWSLGVNGGHLSDSGANSKLYRLTYTAKYSDSSTTVINDTVTYKKWNDFNDPKEHSWIIHFPMSLALVSDTTKR
jgi:hypothetical protein